MPLRAVVFTVKYRVVRLLVSCPDAVLISVTDVREGSSKYEFPVKDGKNRAVSAMNNKTAFFN